MHALDDENEPTSERSIDATTRRIMAMASWQSAMGKNRMRSAATRQAIEQVDSAMSKSMRSNAPCSAKAHSLHLCIGPFTGRHHLEQAARPI